MKKNNTFRRAAALVAALSITVSLAAPAFAGTYYIDQGDITITKDENGQTVKQGNKEAENIGADEEIIITTTTAATTTLESDLEGPAAEDTGFGPVVEENYQQEDAEESEDDDRQESAKESEDDDQKNAEESENDEEQKDADRQENTDRKESDEAQKDADQPENTDRQESADRQAQPQQAAPADAAPAAPAPANGFCKNIITVINNAATALKLTLKDVKIDVSDTGDGATNGKAALSVQGKGNVEIELDGKNELKSGYDRAGLEKNTSEGTLTLKDDNKDGSLTATGGWNGAGIGGSESGSGENITINGGSVTATGGKWAAGIGGGGAGNGKNITINGGTVNAAGGDNGGAGIGGGARGSGEAITITGGTVNAASGDNGGAGIGGGDECNGEDITITGGTVTATGGDYAAGIGGGLNGVGKNITITDGTVTATGDDFGAGIGGGFRGNGENITITGGTVTAAGGNGAGIGGGEEGNGKNITITGGSVTATGGYGGGAGIGGGARGSGEAITITDGTVNAAGGVSGAGIGGGVNGIGSNVTVSGAAQVTTTAGKSDGSYGAGATIGDGSKRTYENGVYTYSDGKEIQADIKGLTTGWIHHIIYEQDGTTIKKEWREPERPQPNPEDPNAPAEESNEVDLGTPLLHVETLEGSLLPFDARQQGSTLRVTTDTLAARLHGTRQALEALREQGVEQIQFVTTLKTTTLSVEDLLAEGGSWFALEHDGLGSRRLSAAQAESLKCQMR